MRKHFSSFKFWTLTIAFFHSNFTKRGNEGCALSLTKRSVCYAEIEKRFHNLARSMAIEMFDSRQKFASYAVCRYFAAVWHYIRLCVKARCCVPEVAIRSGTTEHNVEGRRPLYRAMCLDVCIQTMSNVVRVVADVFVDVHVRGFCRILLRRNRTTQRVPAYVASACKPQKPIVKEKSDWDIGENAKRACG